VSIELLIAIYGAILSTILGIRELLKERKNVTIILEYVTWQERVNLVITNSGHRPVTLTGLTMETIVPDSEGTHWETVPQGALISTSQTQTSFPVKIEDGDSISLPLGPVVSEYLIDNHLNAKILVFDSEGRKYSKFDSMIHDAKWGGISKR
jgi:hypothetical protein